VKELYNLGKVIFSTNNTFKPSSFTDMKKLLIVIIALFVSQLSYGQFLKRGQIKGCESAYHAFYAELGGNAGLYSLNYEHVLFQVDAVAMTARAGVGIMPAGEIGWGSSNFKIPTTTSAEGATGAQTNFPVTASLLIGKNISLFELGAGATFRLYNGTGSADEQSIYPTGVIGFRMHPSTAGGAFLKFVYTPFLVNSSVKHWAGLSFGYAFGERG